jgi:MATE family multidrug resistance protein
VVGIVDNVMVGKLGPTELAAVSWEIVLFFIAMSLEIGFSTAITPMAAQADGKGKLKKERSTFHHGLYCVLF